MAGWFGWNVPLDSEGNQSGQVLLQMGLLGESYYSFGGFKYLFIGVISIEYAQNLVVWLHRSEGLLSHLPEKPVDFIGILDVLLQHFMTSDLLHDFLHRMNRERP